MRDRISTRRVYLAALAATGTSLLAGCSSDPATDDRGTAPDAPGETPTGSSDRTDATDPGLRETAGDETTTPASTATDSRSDAGDDSVAVTGRLVGPSGQAVTSGRVISLGEPEGLVEVSLPADGSFVLGLTSNSTYGLQYTGQVDGLPDLYTIDSVRPRTDVTLGTIRVPRGYPVEIAVVTADGTDVTSEADVSVTHVRNGTDTGYGLLDNPIDLAGTVVVEAEHGGRSGSRELSVTDAVSVTVTVE